MNGDGLVDRVKAYSAGGVNYRTTWINTGSGWQEDPNYALPDIILYRVNSTEQLSWGEFVDVNGDGLVRTVLKPIARVVLIIGQPGLIPAVDGKKIQTMHYLILFCTVSTVQSN